MGPHEARHEEERARAIARLEEADGLVDHPVGGMQALLVCPRVRDPRVVLHTGSVHVGEFTQLVLEEAHVVVGDVLVHPVGQVRLTVVTDVAVVQAHVLEAAAEARRVHVHLADHGRLVAAVAHLLREHMVVLPRDTVLVSHAARAGRRPTREEGGAGGNATRTRRVGVLEQHAVGGECVEVGRLHIRVPVHAQAIAPHLIAHDEEDVRLFGHNNLQAREKKVADDETGRWAAQDAGVRIRGAGTVKRRGARDLDACPNAA